MATITINGTLSLDESTGLQTGGTPVGFEDNDDNDVLSSTLPSAFSDYLFTTLNLSSDFPDLVGVGRSASDFVQVTNQGSTVTGLEFTLDGPESNITTLAGNAVTLSTAMGGQVVLGTEAGTGDIVFALYLDPSADKSSATVWSVVFEPIAHSTTTDHDEAIDVGENLKVSATTSLAFDFNDLPSGQNLFGTVGDPASAIVVIGANPVLNADGTYTNTSDTINTSKGGGPTTIGVNNQMFDPGEGAYFTYVSDPVESYLAGAPDGLDQNEADDADNIQFGGLLNATSAYLVISQTQGNSAASLSLTALNTGYATGQAFVDGLDPTEKVDIIAVQVLDSPDSTSPLETWENGVEGGLSSGVTISVVDGVATISGLSANDVVKWTVDGTHNRVLVTDQNGKFDIGGFGVTDQGSGSEVIGTEVFFEDDGPTVTQETEAATVEEDDLEPDGNNEDGSANADVATGDLRALVDVGNDTPGSWEMLTDTAGLPDLYSAGDQLAYGVSGDTLTATAGGRTIFTLQVETDGDYTFTLLDQIDHEDDGNNDENSLDIDFSSLVRALDEDGDSTLLNADQFVVTIVDDIPIPADATESATVEEDDLPDGNDEDGSGTGTNTVATGTISGLVSMGTDQPGSFSMLTDTSDLPTLTSAGDAVTYSFNLAGDTLIATADVGGANEREVFTLNVTGAGAYTFTLLDQLDHEDDGNNDENSLDIDFSSILLATDEDGDETGLNAEQFVVTVVDDIPETTAETESAMVEEDDLPGGYDEDNSATNTTATGTLTALASIGADQPGSFELLADASGLPALTSGGDTVGYNVSGDTLTATAGGRDVFTLQVSANGAYTFTLLDRLDHEDDGNNDENDLDIDLSSVVAAVDEDGDSVTLDPGQFVVTVQDDIPAIGPIADSTVDFAAGAFATKLLGAIEGIDRPGTLEVTNYTSSLTYDFASLTGTLSSDGKTVTYFEDMDGGTAGTYDAGIDDLYFTLELDDSDADAANWDYTFTVHKDPAPAALEFDFNDLPSGQNLFGTVGNPDNAIVVIGRDVSVNADGTYTNTSDTINTSKGGGPTTIGVNNQMFDPGEGAYFTYVNDPVEDYLAGAPNGLDQNEADNINNIQFGSLYDVDNAFLVISQIQGNAAATIRLTALDTTDTGGADFGDDVDGTAVGIVEVRVYDSTGSSTPLETWTSGGGDAGQSSSINIMVDGDGVSVSGLTAGDKVEWVVAGTHNRVLVENVAGKFDVGGFGFTQAQPTPDAQLDFTVSLTDYDGDTFDDSFSIGVDGTGIYDDDTVVFIS